MIVRRYRPTDWPELAAWGRAWNEDYAEDLFPKTGFIVPGIAAYFLYATDSKVCYLENLVSNPRASDRERESAVLILTHLLMQEARKQGFRVAYACTNNAKVIERAIRCGADVKSRYALLTKNLGQATTGRPDEPIPETPGAGEEIDYARTNSDSSYPRGGLTVVNT